MTYAELIDEARNIPSLRGIGDANLSAEFLSAQAQRYKQMAQEAFRIWENGGYRDNQALAMNTAFEIVQRGYEDALPKPKRARRR